MNRKSIMRATAAIVPLTGIVLIVVGCMQMSAPKRNASTETGWHSLVRAPASFAPTNARRGMIVDSQGRLIGSAGFNEITCPTDELWIIQRPTAPQDKSADSPGTGCLMATPPGTDQSIPMPLKHTDVHSGILGYIATVDVTQQYHN